MARSDLILESLISYYSTLGMDAVTLCRTTREEIRTESLDWKKTTSRMASWWSDAFEGWWSALLTSGTPPLPILFLTCRADSKAHSNYVRVAVPGTGKPDITTLRRVETGEALKAKVETTHFRDQITVKLRDLAKPKSGTYVGIVHLDERPLVQVLVEIQPGGNGNGGADNGSGGPSPRAPSKAKRTRKPTKR